MQKRIWTQLKWKLEKLVPKNEEKLKELGAEINSREGASFILLSEFLDDLQPYYFYQTQGLDVGHFEFCNLIKNVVGVLFDAWESHHRNAAPVDELNAFISAYHKLGAQVPASLIERLLRFNEDTDAFETIFSQTFYQDPLFSIHANQVHAEMLDSALMSESFPHREFVLEFLRESVSKKFLCHIVHVISLTDELEKYTVFERWIGKEFTLDEYIDTLGEREVAGKLHYGLYDKDDFLNWRVNQFVAERDSINKERKLLESVLGDPPVKKRRVDL